MLKFMPVYNINKKMQDDKIINEDKKHEQVILDQLSPSEKNTQIDNWINSNHDIPSSDFEEDISNIKILIKDLESQHSKTEQNLKKSISALNNKIIKEKKLYTQENIILVKKLTNSYKRSMLQKNKQIKRLRLRNRRLINFNNRKNKEKKINKISILKLIASIGSFYYLGYTYLNTIPVSLSNIALYAKQYTTFIFDRIYSLDV
ncbi:unknown [Gryllus bimaculatus nudivirus]|uniref:Transmembrane protein n=1 Tax=Gryllus bimaculatus nudivirus TaxID=432587 RepID=A4L234_9VIRU|nr:hypothetical protein GrBNV_gp71 [Gryllus bimaculatus nudivirus]ABO45404.1 unknown [Gryllus bimaculatus nudivirus]